MSTTARIPRKAPAETTSKVAWFLTSAVETSGKTQKEIAREVGFGKPQIITMMKQGDTKIPLHRIPALAKALDVDAKQFMRLALKEYRPEEYESIVTAFSREIVTDNEVLILEAVRKATNDLDPKPTQEFLKEIAKLAADL